MIEFILFIDEIIDELFQGEKKMNALLAHCDTKYTPEEEVRAVKEPEFTKTWHPIGHDTIIDTLELGFKNKGLDIPAEYDRKYSLSENGKTMFGVWNMAGGQETEMGWSIGIRNSMEKKFAVGICAGNTVFVCDNLIFDGKFIEFRKHTGNLDSERLMSMTDDAIDGVIKRLEGLTKWHVKLKEVDLKNDAFKVLAFDSLLRGVFPPSKFKEFVNCYEEENNVSTDTAETLYAFHGAITRLMRGNSLFSVSNRSEVLMDTCNDYIDMVETPEKASLFKKFIGKLSLSF